MDCQQSLTGRLAPTIVAVVAGLVYVRTLLPGMAFGDWGEMQTVPHVLGVAHPTGYPAYVLIGWVAQLAPLGSVAFRANLLSALLVAGALAVTAAILIRLGVRPIIAVAGALALGAVRTVWSTATVAEVDPLHLLLVALLLHRALVWADERRPRDLVIGSLLVGLALGNHLLTLFVAPFVAIFVIWIGRHEIAARPRALAAMTATAALGLSAYLYVPIAAAGSPLVYNGPVTIERFAWLVSGTQFRGQFGFLEPGGAADLAGSFASLSSVLARTGTPVFPVLGTIGLMVLFRWRRAYGLMSCAILLATLYAWATYLRLEHYLLVVWLVLAIGAAVAVESVARLTDHRPLRSSRLAVAPLLGALCLASAVCLTAANWRSSDRSADDSASDYVDAVFAALPPNAAILSEWDASTPLWHAQLVLDRRPDVLIVDDTNVVYEGWGTRERRIASLICERPVFIIRLRDHALVPTRERYRLEPFIPVRVALGGPSAAVRRDVYRIAPRIDGDCHVRSADRSADR